MPEPGAPLRALIVGCGAIAGGYDEAGDEHAVRTHAGAYSRHGRFHLAACIEPDDARRRAFMDRWQVERGFESLEQCRVAGGSYDMASVCLPTASHGAALEALLDMDVGAVLAEKPLTADPAASQAIVDAYASAGRPLAVNYLRRFDAEVIRLRDEIAAGAWGAVQSVSAHYAKGLLNCGSHAIDLIHFLLGPLSARDVIASLVDYDANDPTVTARLALAGGVPVHLIGCDGRQFFPFEIDLVMEKGRISFEDLGVRIRRRWVRPHPLFLSQLSLDDGVWVDTELPRALANAVGNVYDHLTDGAPLLCTGADAVAAERVCSELRDMMEKSVE